MKRTFLLAAFAMLTGCAAQNEVMRRDISPSQNWRTPEGETVTISGDLELINKGAFSAPVWFLTVKFNGETTAAGELARDLSGEIGGLWRKTHVSSTCNSQRKTSSWVDVRCMVFVGNERTVTLTF